VSTEPTPPSDAGALAGALASLLVADFGLATRGRTVIGIAGESGSGKSVTATALAAALDAVGFRAGLIHQDDYFVRPPRTNHEHRLRDLGSVGPQEVDLALVAAHVAAFRGARDDVPAPRVDYPGNQFLTHRLDFAPLAVLVVEGTYVLQLADLDVRIFLDATHHDTRARRRLRNRDIDAPVIETILDLEHAIIARQASVADILVDREFAIRRPAR
jgi:uridine kinase